MISTRGRYALRVMIDLAEHQNGNYIPMKEVADRQDISLKYIEKIMPLLTKAKLVDGQHGKGGGYKLIVDTALCRVGDILRLTEGDLAPVACLGCDALPCSRASQCRTLPMWEKFNHMANEYFDGITLADLMNTKISPEYII